MNAQDWNPNFLEISPIFEPFHILGRHLRKPRSWPDLVDLGYLRNNAAMPVVNHSGKPICFVPQISSASELVNQYEPRIYLAGEVQTRAENWHDFFNALVWITYPRAKAALNQLHFQGMLQAHRHKKMQRGPLRDAATLFDESGVVVISSDVLLIELLESFEWKELFWQQRAAVLTSMKFFVFGHGLYEKALNPYLGMTGKGIIFKVEAECFDQPTPTQLVMVDMMLEKFLSQYLHTTSNLVPVPVLGYPGWSTDNMDSSYYDNQRYFRPYPARRAK